MQTLSLVAVLLTLVVAAYAVDVPGTCPDQWESSGLYCYLFKPKAKVIKSDAEAQCKKLGGNLISIQTEWENEFLKTRMSAVLQSWIGLHQEAGSTDYTWSDGSCGEYRSWAPGEPNAVRGGQCVEFYPGSGQWNDHGCDLTIAFACKTPKQVQRKRDLSDLSTKLKLMDVLRRIMDDDQALETKFRPPVG